MTDHNKKHQLLIACFHYFREDTYKAGIYPVNKASMKRQIDAISNSYSFVNEADLLRWKKEGAPAGKYCLITFDDGLKEQLNAYRFLQEMGVPSIYYVPSGHYENKRVLEVHKLHFVRTQLDDEAIASELKAFDAWNKTEFKDDVLETQYPFDSVESRRVKYFINFILSAKEKAELTDLLFGKLVEDEEAFFDKLYLSEEEIKVMSSTGSIGAHGRSHTPLSRFSGDELVHEITHSTEYLEGITGEAIRSFAYPYGGNTAVNENTWKAFANTYVELAHTTWHGINNANAYKEHDCFYLQRVDTNYVPGGKNDKGEF